MTTRHKDYHQNIVDNVRRNNPNLAPFTDDEVYNAYHIWAMSEDYPNEALIAEWIGVGE